MRGLRDACRKLSSRQVGVSWGWQRHRGQVAVGHGVFSVEAEVTGEGEGGQVGVVGVPPRQPREPRANHSFFSTNVYLLS